MRISTSPIPPKRRKISDHIPAVIRDITDKKRAEEEIRQRVKELELLYQSAQQLQTLRSPRKMAQNIIQKLRKNLPYGHAALFLRDEATGLLEPLAYDIRTGTKTSENQGKTLGTDHGFHTQKGIIKWVADHGESAVIGLPGVGHGFRPSYPGVLTELCVPLISKGQVIGVLDIASRQKYAYKKNDLQLLETIGAQLATAIQNALLLERMEQYTNQLHALSRRLIEAREAEWRNIGRELHDEIGQQLTGLKLVMEIIPRLPPDMARERIHQAQSMISEMMDRVNSMTLELRPPMLDDLGLLPALLWHLDRFGNQTGIHVVFGHSGIEGKRFLRGIETVAYRIVQEALTNIARHAQVGKASLRITANHTSMQLEISDRGRGFLVKTAFAAGHGLIGMRERVRLTGGEFTIKSKPYEGTRLVAVLPLKKSKRETAR
jgi:signal transduction histidine kinase